MTLAALSLGVIAFALASSPPSSPPSTTPTLDEKRDHVVIAMLDVVPATKADQQLALFLTSAYAEATTTAAANASGTSSTARAKVITGEEIKALMDATALQALMGCSDPRCSVTALSKVLAVDQLVVTKAGTLPGAAASRPVEVLVFTSIIDMKTASVKARASHSFKRSDDINDAARALATKAWSAAASNDGDRLLQDMRATLVFDEAVRVEEKAGVAAASEKLRPVEACVEEHLLKAGMQLVSVPQVGNVRGATSALLAGETPSFLTSKDVDAVLASRIEYVDGGKFAGAVRAEADMSMRLVQIDTGTIIAAKQLRAVGNGFNPNAARKDAATKLCADVKPTLAQALGERRARGHRVVVDVANLGGARNAEPIANVLRKVKDVASVRIARFDDASATIDVMVAGGDGLSLALEMLAANTDATSSVRITSAEPSTLKVTVAR